MSRRRLPLLAAATLALLALTGCTMQSELPTYDTLRTETTSAMQKVVDLLPASSRVADLTDPTPFGCGGSAAAPDSSKGVFYTGHWAVYPPLPFDTDAFFAGLPDSLGPGFEQQSTGLKLSFPALEFRANAYGNSLMSVTGFEEDGQPGIDILVTSRCAQEPTSATP